MNNLVVVESPSKSKTIGRYLNTGSNSKAYTILATGGHIYESNKVEVDNDFKLNYDLIPSKRTAVDSITKAMRTADRLYLATDPDREGEAISAHVLDYLEKKGVLKDKEVHRIVFYEVTQQAVLESLEKPGDVSKSLVEAQQSRDALDWLVGFNLSPLLMRKLSTSPLSAGRVQSPALRLIVERQREIDRFDPVEFWTIAAKLSKPDESGSLVQVDAQLTHLNSKKLGKHEINSKDAADSAIAAIEDALKQEDQKLTVIAVNQKKRRRRPLPPFKTSTFVQSATSRLKRSAADVTRIAQKLYEGLDINGSLTGLITYTRTDSLTLSEVALTDIRKFVSSKYGKEHLPQAPRRYKTTSKSAQEAHEAIRPTNVSLTPDKVRSSLSPDEYRVYELIWKRTVASQMNDAIYNEVSVDFSVAEHQFRASGSTLIEAGWMTVLKDEPDKNRNSENQQFLPTFEPGERVPVSEINSEQHFTKPPPRYNTGSLVKKLEEHGIGRPSTWPTIITKLINRNYVSVQNQSFYAQSLGCMVVDYLNEHFSLYVDYEFTSKVEDKLDDIAQGEIERSKVLNEFWGDFSTHLKSKLEAPRFEFPLGNDPETGREILVRVRNGGTFLQLGRRADEIAPLFRALPKETDPRSVTLEYAIGEFSGPSLPRTLEEKTQDGREVTIKTGRYGPYFSCTDADGKVENFSIDDTYDPLSITIEGVESILKQPKLPRSLGKTEEFTDIVASRGRFGPYLSATRNDGTKINANLGKENPATITLERAVELIKASKGKSGARGTQRSVIKAFSGTGIQILDGRYGPYITDGKVNVTVPRDLDPTKMSPEKCQELLEEKKLKGPKKRPSSRRKKKAS